jgi:hypothetical protein
MNEPTAIDKLYIKQKPYAKLGIIFPHNKLKVISFETMPCNPNKRL